MVCVFSVFATLQMMIFKQFGVGLAAAILIDATIVRRDTPARFDDAVGRLELVPTQVARVASAAQAAAPLPKC